jgi:predicted Zn-dependent protease
MHQRSQPRAVVLLVVLLTAAHLSCAVNPATGAREFMLVSEGQEIAMGRNADPQIVAAYGLYPDSGMQRYLRGIGEELAALSERPHLPWTFRVLDDATVNAFALPGGYNYITRGIMAYFESEAELVSVMGHELGHVTARHGAHQMSQQQLASIGLVATAVLLPENLQGFMGLAAAGVQIMFLKFSRSDESEADMLGLRYMSAARYDPYEMPNVYEMLNSVSMAASGGERLPTWLSTHPNPVDRGERILELIDAQPRPLGTIVRRSEYLARLEGMTFGQNPREGFFRAQLFLHPELAFQLLYPAGWATQNQRSMVAAQSSEKDAIMMLTLVDDAASAQSAATAFSTQEGLQSGTVARRTINGFVAASVRFEASLQDGTLVGEAYFIEFDGSIFRIIGYATPAAWPGYETVFRRSAQSFDRLTDPSALNVQPLTLTIVTTDRAMTLEQFSARYPSEVDIDQLALLNRRGRGETIPAGTRLKRVVGGPVR